MIKIAVPLNGSDPKQETFKIALSTCFKSNFIASFNLFRLLQHIKKILKGHNMRRIGAKEQRT